MNFFFVLILFLIGAFIISSFRKIPVRHVGQITILSKRQEGQYVEEGWHFLPFYPFFYGVILIDVGKVQFEVVVEKSTTPDKASSRVPVGIVFEPLKDHLVEYINSGGKDGVINQFTGKIKERVREWCSDEEGGPVTWWELNQSRLEGVSVLVTKLARNSITEIPLFAQDIPTWIWLRFFSKPRPKKFMINEEAWAKDDWKLVKNFLLSLTPAQQASLETAVAKRREEVLGLMTGTGKIKAEDLGIIIKRLNIEDVDVLGKVAEQAEQAAKEEQERRAEEIELNHVEKQIKKFVSMGYSMAEAKELVQTERGKVTKNIDEKKVTLSQETGEIVKEVVKIFKK